MRRQDKQRPKPRGVWVELERDGNVSFVPVRLTQIQAVALMQKSVARLEQTKGMARQ